MDRLPPELQQLLLAHVVAQPGCGPPRRLFERGFSGLYLANAQLAEDFDVAAVCHSWREMVWANRLAFVTKEGSVSMLRIQQSTRALIRIGPGAVLRHAPLLQPLLQHPSCLVRHSALIALSALGDEWVAAHALPAFLARMKDADDDVSFTALCALSKLPIEVLAPHGRSFRACLKHASPAARCGALHILGRIGAVSSSLKSVSARLQDDEPQVRHAAAAALATLAPAQVPAHVTAALRARLQEPEEAAHVRSRVLETMSAHEQSAQTMGLDVCPGLNSCNDGLGGMRLS
jgi:HEAT repeat protein